MSEQLLAEIKQIIDNYYKENYHDNAHMMQYISGRPLLENIMSLCERNRNMEKRLKDLEPEMKRYRDDANAAINVAVKNYIDEYTKTITIHGACKLIQGMSLTDIAHVIVDGKL